jgi:hypothetical protein
MNTVAYIFPFFSFGRSCHLFKTARSWKPEEFCFTLIYWNFHLAWLKDWGHTQVSCQYWWGHSGRYTWCSTKGCKGLVSRYRSLSVSKWTKMHHDVDYSEDHHVTSLWTQEDSPNGRRISRYKVLIWLTFLNAACSLFGRYTVSSTSLIQFWPIQVISDKSTGLYKQCVTLTSIINSSDG